MMPRRHFLAAGAALMVTPRGLVAQPSANGLAVLAEQFRKAAVRSVRTAVSNPWVTPGAARSLRLPDVGGPLVDAFHRYSFSTFITFLGHRAAEKSIIGYYSPLLDCWWIALCTGQAMLEDGRLVPGPLFGEAVGDFDNLANLRRLGAIETLRQRSRLAVHQFRSQFALDTRAEPVAFARLMTNEAISIVIRDRIVQLAGTLDTFAADHASIGMLEAVLGSLLTGQLPNAGILSTEAGIAFVELAASSPSAELDFAPLFAINGGNWWLVCSARPSSGNVLLFTEIQRNPNLLVTRLALIDVAR